MNTGSMTKAELVEEVSRVSDLTKKHSEVIVDTVFKSIIDALHRGEKIELRGFGSFRLRQREPRKGRNPKTGDKVDVPPKKVPYFKPGKELKELINREPDGAAAAGGRRRRHADSGLRTRRASSMPAAAALDARHASMEHLWSPWRLDYVTGDATAPPAASSATRSRPATQSDLVVFRGPTCFVILNLYPYNNGHLMVVPNRHVATSRTRRADELHELMRLTQRAEIALTEAYAPHGINIGINLGRPAGAGVLDHLHVHLVPRWNGDTNFMTVVGDTRVLPEELPQTRRGCGRSSSGSLRRSSTSTPLRAANGPAATRLICSAELVSVRAVDLSHDSRTHRPTSRRSSSSVAAVRARRSSRRAPRRSTSRRRFPRDVMRAAAALGLLGVTIPTEWGGAGRDYVSYALAIEAMRAASASSR